MVSSSFLDGIADLNPGAECAGRPNNRFPHVPMVLNSTVSPLSPSELWSCGGIHRHQRQIGGMQQRHGANQSKGMEHTNTQMLEALRSIASIKATGIAVAAVHRLQVISGNLISPHLISRRHDSSGYSPLNGHSSLGQKQTFADFNTDSTQPFGSKNRTPNHTLLTRSVRGRPRRSCRPRTAAAGSQTPLPPGHTK